MSGIRRKIKVVIWLVAIISVLILIFNHFANNVKKVYETLSGSQIKSYIYQTVNSTAKELIKQRTGISMISTKENAEGEVVKILIDNDNVNILNQDIAVRCQDNLSLIEQAMVVHLGAFTDFKTFADKGHTVMIPLTVNYTVNSKVKAYSEKIGINVIRYALYLCVTTNAEIVLPIGSAPQEFVNYILITEIVFTSKVPETFIASEDGLNYLDLLP